MTVEIKAPAFPESVADGVVSAWHKGPGDSVARDELLVEIETDKVVMEVVAPAAGVIETIMAAEGETITSEMLLATLSAGADGVQVSEPPESEESAAEIKSGSVESIPMGPAVRALLDEHDLSPEEIEATGKGWATAERRRYGASEAAARTTVRAAARASQAGAAGGCSRTCCCRA